VIIKCHVCNADPAGRWRSPPMCIFIDHVKGERVYACRDHLTPRKEEVMVRERSLSFAKGALR
jgi:hypothetical protein